MHGHHRITADAVWQPRVRSPGDADMTLANAVDSIMMCILLDYSVPLPRADSVSRQGPPCSPKSSLFHSLSSFPQPFHSMLSAPSSHSDFPFNLLWAWFQVEWKHNTVGVSKNSRHFVVPLCAEVLMLSVSLFSHFNQSMRRAAKLDDRCMRQHIPVNTEWR